MYSLHCDLIDPMFIQVFTWNKVICMCVLIGDETGGQYNGCESFFNNAF